jgi:hypothetical protein
MADTPASAGETKVRWDDSKARRAHANECAVSLGRDQFVVSFGVSQAPQAGQPDGLVEVTREVAMTPYVAKQLAVLLDRVLREYESRYGEGRRAGTPPARKGDSTGTV